MNATVAPIVNTNGTTMDAKQVRSVQRRGLIPAWGNALGTMPPNTPRAESPA
ncbi:MAG: hypothetical protein RL077_716 [Verrucomicrobiota bacterium]|jgi:hypothetical protein